MVDFATQSRHYGYKYNAPEIRTPTTTNRDLYRQNEVKLFKTPRGQVHDCREDVMKKFTDPEDWQVWMLSSELQNTYHEITALHKIPKRNEKGKSQRDKLLFTVGDRGIRTGQFQFPRAVVGGRKGEIFVVDSGNHRIQVFNQFGVYLRSFGERGTAAGHFLRPSGLTLLGGGHLAVADHGNGRVQIVTESGRFKYEFRTVDDPVYLCSDWLDNIVVSTASGHVEIYGRSAKLRHRFPISGSGVDDVGAPCPVATNDKDEVIVANAAIGRIQYYTYDGRLLRHFEPSSANRGLTCRPTALVATPGGEILLADGLNHVVSSYDGSGRLLATLVRPTDGAGSIQSLAVGIEGHLLTTEFSNSDAHCVKIYRYNDCDCHRERPGSAKKRSSLAAK